MDKKKILILSITDQDMAPRVIRQIDALKEEYDIYCCGLKNSIIKEEKFYRIERSKNSLTLKLLISAFKLLRIYGLAEKFILKYKYRINLPEKLPEFDLIIAHDLDAVAISYNTFISKNVIVDLHEYAQEEFGETYYWKLVNKEFLSYQCRKYFPVLNAATTVCQSISDEYEKNFSLSPVVITNAAPYYDLKPSETKEKIRIISHGGAIKSRRIELMIEIAKNLDERFTLDLMLLPNDKNYYNKLKLMADETDNVKIIPPVGFNEIVKYCNSYDIGLYVIFPTNLNNKYSLPNKFFEFIQSRLAIVTGPSVEMEKYMKNYNLGITAKTFDPLEIASEINKLTNVQIDNFKKNSHLHSKELSSETNSKILKNIVRNLIGN